MVTYRHHACGASGVSSRSCRTHNPLPAVSARTVSFRLFPIYYPLPGQYRLATVQEVRENRGELFEAMPSWEIANLADGSVDGVAYGGVIREERRNDVGHKLATQDSNVTHTGPRMTFTLFPIRDQLPAQYRLATVQEVQENREELFKAMPRWEIANLADGSVDGAAYGGHTRCKMRNLWIVTEVLYATKFTVTGRTGLFDRVMVQVSVMGAPGLSAEARADIGVHFISDSSIELKAKRNKHFIVGYRTMRVEYNLDGTLRALIAGAVDTSLRGDDDHPHHINLISMEEDNFEVDEDGDKVPIPLLTPTEQELNDLRLLALNSRDSEGSAST